MQHTKIYPEALLIIQIAKKCFNIKPTYEANKHLYFLQRDGLDDKWIEPWPKILNLPRVYLL